MGRGRRGGKAGATKKKALTCPDGACFLGSDSDSACSDSDCSDCGPPRARGRAKSRPKSAAAKPAAAAKKKKKKPKKAATKRRARDSSSSCSCSDCQDDSSSDDCYDCRPARGRRKSCSTC